MRYQRWLLLVIVLVAVSLSACATTEADVPPRATPTPEIEDPPLPPRDELPSPDAESPVETPQPDLESPVATPSPGTVEFPEVARELRSKVAADMGLSPDSLTARSVERVTWRDASLGCPEPGKMYAQVLTEGWKVIYQHAEEGQIEVHATQNLDTFVICEGESGGDAEQPAAPEDNPAVQAAVEALAQHLGVDVETLSIQHVEPVEWPTSCLGCGRANEACLTVITPGYRIMLKHEETVYEMRTDRVGDSVRLCERGGL